MKKVSEKDIMTALDCGEIKLLDDCQIDVNHKLQEENGDSLLLYAIGNEGNNSIYKELIARHADIYAENDLGENIIHSIVFSGDPSRLQYVLTEFPGLIKEINHQDHDGTTPLLLSILIDKPNLSLQLIDSGADVNIADNNGNAPVHIACWSGYLDVVKALVGRGADILAKTSNGNSPLALAINQGHTAVAEYLFPLWLKLNKL